MLYSLTFKLREINAADTRVLRTTRLIMRSIQLNICSLVLCTIFFFRSLSVRVCTAQYNNNVTVGVHEANDSSASERVVSTESRGTACASSETGTRALLRYSFYVFSGSFTVQYIVYAQTYYRHVSSASPSPRPYTYILSCCCHVNVRRRVLRSDYYAKQTKHEFHQVPCTYTYLEQTIRRIAVQVPVAAVSCTLG